MSQVSKGKFYVDDDVTVKRKIANVSDLCNLKQVLLSINCDALLYLFEFFAKPTVFSYRKMNFFLKVKLIFDKFEPDLFHLKQVFMNHL